MNAPQRLNNIVNYIITNHGRKTHNKSLTAIFCVPSVSILIEYYKLFQAKYIAGEHTLKVGTTFSYGANVDLEKVIGDFIYTEKEPLRDDIIGLMRNKPSLKERKSIAE